MTRKICVVVTARPSYSRIKTALQAIKDHPDLDLQLVIAASALLGRYGSVIEQIEADGFEIHSKSLIVAIRIRSLGPCVRKTLIKRLGTYLSPM